MNRLLTARISRELFKHIRNTVFRLLWTILALDMLDSDAPAESINPFATASADIEASFKQFLDSQEIERIGYPGVPTQAALDGVRTSYKNPTGNKNKRGKRVKHPRRPSFIDTGLYEDSMKAWID